MKTFSHLAPALALASLLGSLLAACTNDSNPKDSDGVSLSGRVIATNSNPVEGVVVSLAANGAKDTTDVTGRFEIRLASAKGQANDTMVYKKNGQSLARISVANWVDTTLPDVEVIQRDISGLLVNAGIPIARIEGLLTGDGIDSTEPVRTDFYYNSLTGNYSGFVYFPPASSVKAYQVRVNIYGPGSVLVGSSPVVPFTSFAGNVTVPTFNTGNARPIANAGLDTAVAADANVKLHGSAIDSVGTIAGWEWSIGGGAFVAGSKDTTFSRSTPGVYACILRVTDSDGNQALDTVDVSVLGLGANWTLQTSPNSATLNTIAWNPTANGGAGLLVAGGATSGSFAGTILTSPDGTTWTRRTTGFTLFGGNNPSIYTVAWNGSEYLALAQNSGNENNVLHSTDGTTWTPQKMYAGGYILNEPLVKWINGKYIAMSRAQGSFTTSVDGITWANTAGSSIGRKDFVWTGDRFVSVGTGGKVFTSPDATTWTQVETQGDMGSSVGLSSVAWTGSRLIAVGTAGEIYASTDGITWSKRGQAPNAAPLNTVIWTGTQAVAAGQGIVLVSTDGGLSWIPKGLPNSANILSLTWTGSKLVGVGASGVILTSP